MKTFEVEWTQSPTNYNPTRILYVEAIDTEAAKAVAKDHIRRVWGIGDWVHFEVREYVPPLPSMGRVLS